VRNEHVRNVRIQVVNNRFIKIRGIDIYLPYWNKLITKAIQIGFIARKKLNQNCFESFEEFKMILRGSQAHYRSHNSTETAAERGMRGEGMRKAKFLQLKLKLISIRWKVISCSTVDCRLSPGTVNCLSNFRLASVGLRVCGRRTSLKMRTLHVMWKTFARVDDNARN